MMKTVKYTFDEGKVVIEFVRTLLEERKLSFIMDRNIVLMKYAGLDSVTFENMLAMHDIFDFRLEVLSC